MNNTVLAIKGLHKSFGGVAATNDINLDVVKGEVHAIIGPNGAGKTTLISQLSGSIYPDSGSIHFNGQNITRLAAWQRAQAGLARSFQITSLLMDMSVLDNVALAVQARNGHSFHFWKPARKEKRLRNKAMEIITRVGLQYRAFDLTRSLSHGERRQVEIAMALAGEPSLLLLDEPMAGMGAEESNHMIETLRGVAGNITMLLVEHDMDAVFALADRISVLVYGQVIATGHPDDIRENEAVRHAYLGEGDDDA